MGDQFGLLSDGTLVIESGAQAGLLPFGFVVETLETPLPTVTIGVININKGTTYRYNTTPILGALASRRT